MSNRHKHDADRLILEACTMAPEVNSLEELSHKMSIPRKTLERYIRGVSSPTKEETIFEAFQRYAAATDIDLERLSEEHELRYFKSRAAALEKQIADIGTMRKTFLDVAAMLRADPIPVPEPPKVKGGKSHHIAMLHATDWHFGAWEKHLGVLPGYTVEIAEAAIDALFQRVVSLLDRLEYVIVDALIVDFLGDIVENIVLREGQRRSTSLNVAEQVVRVAYRIAQNIRMLAGVYPEVYIGGVSGNHGRTTRKKGVSDPWDSFDWLTYKFVEALLSNQPNVKFMFPRTWYMFYVLYGKHVVYTMHGAEIRCFVPDSPVVMHDWTTRGIQDIVSGDVVLSHDGWSHKVEEIFRYQYDGKIVVLEANMLPGGTLKATPNHEIPVVFASQLTCPHKRHLSRAHQRCSESTCGYDIAFPEIQWAPISHVSPGDYLIVPLPKKDVSIEGYNTQDFLVGFPEKLHPREKAIPPHIPANEDLGLVIGQYLADGNCQGASLKWNHEFHTDLEICFHEDEEQFWLEAMEAFERLFGFPARLVTRRDMTIRAQRLQMSSRRVAAVIGALAGHGSKTKILHESVLRWPISALKSLLIGYLRGDGHTARRKYHGKYDRTFCVIATTMSPELGWQIYWIARRCGYMPSIKFRDRHGAEAAIIFFGDDARELGPQVQRNYVAENDAQVRKVARWGCIDFDDFMLAKVRSAYQVDYSGPVHDLAVADVHTYVVNGAAVHNSYVGFPWYGFSRAATNIGGMMTDEAKGRIQRLDFTDPNLSIDRLLDLLALIPDTVVIGHFHQEAYYRLQGRNLIAANAMIPTTEYIAQSKYAMTRPSQTLSLFSKTWGRLVTNYLVWLDDVVRLKAEELAIEEPVMRVC